MKRIAVPRPELRLSDEQYAALRQRFSADEDNYNFLNETHPVAGRRKVWDGDYVRQEYLRSVDHLIGVLDGTILDRQVQPAAQDVTGAPEVVVWLDKSARPASWFVDAFWEQLAVPDSRRPRYEFLRIDRRDWLGHMGYTDAQAKNAAPKTVDIGAVPEELILRIRVLFCAEPVDAHRWQDQVATAPTTLDGLDVLVVDETMVSGATLKIATGLVARAAPAARVSGDYFWRDTTSKVVGGVTQRATVPVWYPGENTDGSEVTVFGRGVGNSSAAYWNQCEDSDEVIRKRIAAAMVSAPHHDPRTFDHLRDVEAEKLLQDIAYLTYDYAAGLVLRRPSPLRPDNDYDRIVAEQDLAFDEFVAFKDRHYAENKKRVW
jgi:hypothetical protein